MNPKDKLQEIYNKSYSITDITDIPEEISNHLKLIGAKCFSQKGVYTVITTLLLYKILYKSQDIRKHQKSIDGGFSGRSFDTQYVTPKLKELGMPSMAESGWLTRSLEQPYIYDMNYNGKISGGLKLPFLTVLDFIQKNADLAYNALRIVLNGAIKKRDLEKIVIIPLTKPELVTIEQAIESITEHFNHNYNTHGGSKLPVIAFHSIYQCLITEINRYHNCTLSDISNNTASDRTSKTAGDLEIIKNNKIFEAIEIKLDKPIDCQITRIAIEKIKRFNPQRYYILSNVGIRENEKEDIGQLVLTIKREHGCQLIINGLIPTIKYYLRLINSVAEFIEFYSNNIQNDNELQAVHKEKWNQIIEDKLN